MVAAAPLCSTIRKCSSIGKECLSEDRDCQNAAVHEGLEVTCERSEDHTFVYCPPGAEQRDSGVVWALLALAFLVAIGGSFAFWRFFLRGRSGSGAGNG